VAVWEEYFFLVLDYFRDSARVMSDTRLLGGSSLDHGVSVLAEASLPSEAFETAYAWFVNSFGHGKSFRAEGMIIYVYWTSRFSSRF
jgi:hypothetical protein